MLQIFGVHCISWPTQTCRNLSEILLGKRCEPASLGLPFAHQFHGGGCAKVNTFWYRFEFEHIFCVPLDVLALFWFPPQFVLIFFASFLLLSCDQKNISICWCIPVQYYGSNICNEDWSSQEFHWLYECNMRIRGNFMLSSHGIAILVLQLPLSSSNKHGSCPDFPTKNPSSRFGAWPWMHLRYEPWHWSCRPRMWRSSRRPWQWLWRRWSQGQGKWGCLDWEMTLGHFWDLRH